jgi:protein SCO1/2
VDEQQQEPSGTNPTGGLRAALSLLVPLVLVGVLGAILAMGDERPEWLGGPDRPDFGDFTLQSRAGPVSLSNFAGKVVVVYFGYATCPDVCPTTLQTTAAAFKRLPPEDRARLAGLFVSVDPQRDTVEALATYAAFFDPLIQGVTGSDAEVRAIAKDWGVDYAIVPQPESALGYAVDHTGLLFVVNADGSMRVAMPHGVPLEVLLLELRDALQAAPPPPKR